MIALSVLAGIVMAGFVWYGWNLWENITVARENFNVRKAEAPEQDDVSPGEQEQEKAD